jgi:peptidoglycan/LPS O-acetylase OafA/YrhL
MRPSPQIRNEVVKIPPFSCNRPACALCFTRRTPRPDRSHSISTLAHPAYRPEIDGLRMIAVLAVVLYHFGVPGLPGGFSGVDVFFVISGFLIGGILWRDYAENGRLHLARFYIRRVKRLAPAYFVMAAVSAAVAWVVLLPFEFREFGKSLIAATVYLSNVLFWRGEGYFDIGAENKVLLHTWSLSVEEQFYVALPLLIVLLRFSRGALLAALWLGFAASLLACLWITPRDGTSAFYLFPFRAWELLAGVLLAVMGHLRGWQWRVHGALSWAGLALVLGGIGLISAEGFPGWQALLPVAGTVLLLANGRHANPVNRVLAAPVPVFFGRISYSLYLWHWPVLVLSKYWREGHSGWFETAGWLGLALALAVLSWRFVETPVRRIEGMRGRTVLAALTLPSAMMLAIGALAYLRDGLPARFAPETRVHIAASADFLQDWSRCHTPASGAFEGVELCPFGPDGAPKVLVWGDSHVRAFKEGLEQAAFEAGVPGLIIWHAGCPPLFDVVKRESYATRAEDANCMADTATIRAGLATLTSVERVLLIGRWAYYATGAGVGRDADNTVDVNGLGGSNNAEVMARALTATVAELSGYFREVYVLRQVPEIPGYDSRDMARKLAHGRATATDAAALRVPLAAAMARAGAAEAPLAALAASGAIHLIDPWPMLCDTEGCGALQGGAGWYFDNNHLTNTAARALRGLFIPFLTGAAP